MGLEVSGLGDQLELAIDARSRCLCGWLGLIGARSLYGEGDQLELGIDIYYGLNSAGADARNLK